MYSIIAISSPTLHVLLRMKVVVSQEKPHQMSAGCMSQPFCSLVLTQSLPAASMEFFFK
jgi:hypothetical protein